VLVSGSFAVAGVPGHNAFRFMGRLRGKSLRRGRYQLVAVARDSAGGRSRSATAGFRIIS
jgi:hypothetical protein